jgi:hypothetical protein
MSRLMKILLLLTAAAGLAVPVALAGSPHFVGGATVTVNADGSLTVVAKEAGLGGETISVTLTGDVACVNPGEKKPKAANKHSFADSDTFDVNNGKADINLTTNAPSFTPDCSPPMTIEYSNLVLTDNTNGISLTIPGTFRL